MKHPVNYFEETEELSFGLSVSCPLGTYGKEHRRGFRDHYPSEEPQHVLLDREEL